VELLELKGESVEGEIKFGKWKSSQTGHGLLDFDMKEKHLRDCDRKFYNLTFKLLFFLIEWRGTPFCFQRRKTPFGHNFKIIHIHTEKYF
jgi:hypothetical protein